jgi:hypothetical protein
MVGSKQKQQYGKTQEYREDESDLTVPIDVEAVRLILDEYDRNNNGSDSGDATAIQDEYIPSSPWASPR